MTDYRRQDALVEKMGYNISEGVLYGRYIKYKVLDEILNIYMPNLTKEVNVFIDLVEFLKPIYKFDNIGNPMGILVCMVNLPLHYRHYFNRRGIKSNIFLIYSSNNSVNNTRYLSIYDNKHKIIKETNKLVFDIIHKNIELLNTLTPYLPGIYLKLGTVEPTVITYNLIDKFTRKGNLDYNNIFITSTDYAYQLPSVMSNVLLILKKSMVQENNKNEDNSFGVIQSNSLETYIRFKTKQNISTYLDPRWVSPFMILNGLSCRDIKSLFSYNQAIKILHTIASSYNIITPDTIFDVMNTLYKPKITKEGLYDRYHAIDIDYQLNLYRQMPESIESNFLIDIYDNQALYDINNLYLKGTNNIEFYKL